MGVTGVFLSVGINLILLAAAYLILARRIKRQGSAEYVLGEVRSEVNEMITELNQTADRNIGLLEARISRLQEMIEKADSRLTLLQKETDKHSKGAATYSSVRPKILHQPRGDDAPAAAQRGGNRAAGEGQPELWEAQSSRSAGQQQNEREPAKNEPERREHSQQERSPAEQKNKKSAGTPDKRAKIIELHRQGISPDVIASRVESTIGEVELIITMAEGRGK
jgi:hypothetical protein